MLLKLLQRHSGKKLIVARLSSSYRVLHYARLHLRYHSIIRAHKRFITNNFIIRKQFSSNTLPIKKKSLLRRGLKYSFVFTGISVIISSGVTAYLYSTDEGIARSLYFTYKSLYPFYEYYEAETPQQKKELHEKYAPYFLELILELGGYYIKGAQTLCGMGVLPDEYEEIFDILLDQIPQKDFALMESIICKELNISRLDEVFESMDPKCIGAGSIGQVHRAKLNKEYAKDHNIDIYDVVVKVQYPNVESYFNMDLMTCKYMALLTGGLDTNTIDDVFDKMYESIELEFHYDIEANNMIECEKNLPDHLRAYIKIPKVVEGLCSKDVLVMEFISGERMSDRMSYLMEMYAKSVNKTVEQLKKEWKVTDLDAIDNSNDNANASNESMLRLYRYGLYTKDLLLNSMKWILNIFGTGYEYQWDYKMILNGPKLTRILFEAFGKAILLDGFFNSDPHSGNILLIDYNKWFPIAKEIDLALIDFGNVQKLNKQQRIAIAKLLVAMAEYNTLKEGENDEETLNKIASACIECGMESTKNDVDFLASQALMFFDMRLDKELLDRFDIPHDILYWQKRFNEMDEWKIFPAAFFNLQRCLQLLVQASAQAGSGTPIPSLLWRDIAQQVIRENDMS